MKIGVAPPESINSIWEKVTPLLDRAVSGQNIKREDMADILADCLTGNRLLWIIHDEEKKELVAAFVTSVKNYPMYKALVCEYVGGEKLDDWLELATKTMSEFAEKVQCDTIEVNGREGWHRKLTPFGFERASSTFQKKVQ